MKVPSHNNIQYHDICVVTTFDDKLFLYYYIDVVIRNYLYFCVFANNNNNYNMLSMFVTRTGKPLPLTPVPKGLGEAPFAICFVVFHSLKVLIGYWAHLMGIQDDKKQKPVLVCR